jgi:hypothetical protein
MGAQLHRMRLRLAAAIAVASVPSFAFASTITFSAPTINLTESNSVQTGYFDVQFTATSSVELNEFQVDLLLPSQSNVTFIGADLNTGAPNVLNAASYVFAGNSWDQAHNLPPYLVANQASDYDDPGISPYVTLAGGTAYGLLRVEYSVAANFVGTVALNLNQANLNNNPNADYVSLGTDFSSAYLPNAVNGAIVVTPAPEPATWLLAVLGAVAASTIRRLQARRGAPR